MIRSENRSQSRLFLQCSEGVESVIIHDSSIMGGYIEGELLNISSSGFCVGVASTFKRLDVVKVMIPLLEGYPRIPTMAEVRWVKSYNNGKNGYTAGMRFIF